MGHKNNNNPPSEIVHSSCLYLNANFWKAPPSFQKEGRTDIVHQIKLIAIFNINKILDFLHF